MLVFNKNMFVAKTVLMYSTLPDPNFQQSAMTTADAVCSILTDGR